LTFGLRQPPVREFECIIQDEEKLNVSILPFGESIQVM
jgi:hypothetical protein